MGLAIGALLAPAAAIGAAGLVRIVGSNGKKSEVTAAGQLLTAPAAPSSFRSKVTAGVGNTCVEVFAVPAGKAFVMTSATANVWQNPTPGAANFLDINLSNVCNFSTPVARVNPPGFGPNVVEFDPGFAVKAGSKVYARTLGDVTADVRIAGYLVPKGAVPASTPSTARVVAPARPTQD
jgi:hypothetical protein